MTDYLIMVNVAPNKDGILKPTIINYLTGHIYKKTDVIHVVPGDRVAWVVRVRIGNGPQELPYTVSFFETDRKTPDNKFYGQSTLSVPAGGVSPFLHVRSLVQTIYYSISVPGMGVILDPEMQTGDGMFPVGRKHPTALANSFEVIWDIGNQAMTYQDKNGAHQFPAAGLPIALGDKVGFKAVNGASTKIQVQFIWDAQVWASPFFEAFHDKIPDTAVDPIPPMPVKDDKDQGQSFSFSLVNADGISSAQFNFNLT